MKEKQTWSGFHLENCVCMRVPNFDIKGGGGAAKNNQCNQLTINREIISNFNSIQRGAVAPFCPPPLNETLLV